MTTRKSPTLATLQAKIKRNAKARCTCGHLGQIHRLGEECFILGCDCEYFVRARPTKGANPCQS
ncbi:MAG: hypothetical protein ABSD62_14570 [Candidatus Limnocylindrales bacterium]|jgi:hypothetical protein